MKQTPNSSQQHKKTLINVGNKPGSANSQVKKDSTPKIKSMLNPVKDVPIPVLSKEKDLCRHQNYFYINRYS